MRGSRESDGTTLSCRMFSWGFTLQSRTTRFATALAVTLAVVTGAGAAAPGAFAAPQVTTVADAEQAAALRIDRVEIPASVNLDQVLRGEVDMGWVLSTRDASLKIKITHVATGKTLSRNAVTRDSGLRFSHIWAGEIAGGLDGPNGEYVVEAVARLLDGTGEPVTAKSRIKVTRDANPHDYTDNGATDVLARDASGVLWRVEMDDRPDEWWYGAAGHTTALGRSRIGGGWNAYKHIEAVGNIAGGKHPDLLAVDTHGVLWQYLGRGDGTFATRIRVGGGWGAYNRITGGSDLDRDGRPDLVAADTHGVLWFYKGTGSVSAPFAGRVRIGGGWNIYNHLVAVGNVSGTADGDLVARDARGALWLYRGTGRGTFSAAQRVGGSWGGYRQIIGAGDLDNDGRGDMIGYGPGVTVFTSNPRFYDDSNATPPFSSWPTSLLVGEGSKFTDLS